MLKTLPFRIRTIVEKFVSAELGCETTTTTCAKHGVANAGRCTLAVAHASAFTAYASLAVRKEDYSSPAIIILDMLMGLGFDPIKREEEFDAALDRLHQISVNDLGASMVELIEEGMYITGAFNVLDATERMCALNERALQSDRTMEAYGRTDAVVREQRSIDDEYLKMSFECAALLSERHRIPVSPNLVFIHHCDVAPAGKCLMYEGNCVLCGSDGTTYLKTFNAVRPSAVTVGLDDSLRKVHAALKMAS